MLRSLMDLRLAGCSSWRCRLAGLALLVGLAGWHACDVSTSGLTDRSGRLKAPDFLQFYTYGTLVADGRVAALYQADAHADVARRVVDPALTLSSFTPNYSPAIAWLVAPLASWPFPEAMALFTTASVVLYGAALVILGYSLRWRGRDVVTVAIFGGAYPALFATLRYGQISALSLLIVAAAVGAASRERAWLAGAALGLLAYKPNLLLGPVLVLLAARQWRVLAGLAAGAGLELALDVALVGPVVMGQYLGVLASLARHPEIVQFFPAESHSLRGFVRLLVPWPPLVTAASVAALALAAWLGAEAWRSHQDVRPRWAALVLAGLVASPHLITYDLLLLAVPIVLLLDWGAESMNGPAWAARWGLALLYFGAWPGTFIARLYQVQPSTVGMLGLLWLLARAPREDRA